MSGPGARGPRPLKDVLNALVAARGFGRLRQRAELEDAWAAAVGSSGLAARIERIDSSSTSSTRPSLHSRKRSPRMIGIVHMSTRTYGSMPSARVTMLRRG